MSITYYLLFTCLLNVTLLYLNNKGRMGENAGATQQTQDVESMLV